MVSIDLLDSLASSYLALAGALVCLLILYKLVKIFKQENEDHVKLLKLCKICEQSNLNNSILYTRYCSNTTPSTSLRNKFNRILSSNCHRCGSRLIGDTDNNRNNQEQRILNAHGKLIVETELDKSSIRESSVVCTGLAFGPVKRVSFAQKEVYIQPEIESSEHASISKKGNSAENRWSIYGHRIMETKHIASRFIQKQRLPTNPVASYR